MALDQVANFVRGSTDAAVDSTQTTISVVDASIFPDPANGEYNLVLWDDGAHPRPDQDPDVEIVRVTARDTDTNDLTVTRAQEGTTGVSHPSGSALQLSPTEAFFDDVASTDQITPNTPDWQEDGNSPETATNTTSATLNLADTYDVWEVHFHVRPTAADDFAQIRIQVNGDTGTNYDVRRVDGGLDSSESGIQVALVSNNDAYATVKMQGRFDSVFSLWDGPGSIRGGGVAQGGTNDAVTGPLTSITVQTEGFTQEFIEIEAFGRDIV